MDTQTRHPRTVVALLEEIEVQRTRVAEARRDGRTREVDAGTRRIVRLEVALLRMIGGRPRRRHSRRI